MLNHKTTTANATRQPERTTQKNTRDDILAMYAEPSLAGKTSPKPIITENEQEMNLMKKKRPPKGDPNPLIYEITQKMTDSNVMQKDMQEAIALVQDMFRTRYIDRMKEAAMAQRDLALQNPCREVQLLQAMKGFAPAEKHEEIDRYIQLFTLVDTAKQLQLGVWQAQTEPVYTENDNGPRTVSAASSGLQSSVHEDGVYDVDAACLRRKERAMNSNMAFMLMMMTMM